MSERQCVDCKEMVDISDLTEEMAELRAEIERLKDELPECQMCATINSSDGWYCAECAGAWDVKTVKDAEIERLRGVEMKLQGTLKNQVMINDELRSRLDAAVEPGSDDATGITEIIRTYQSLVVSLPLMDADLARFGDEIVDQLRGVD